MSRTRSRADRRRSLDLVSLLVSATLAGCGPGIDSDQEAEVVTRATREVRLSGAALEAAGVGTAQVTREVFHPRLTTSGVIRPVADQSVTVRAPAAGRVRRVLADVGTRVQRGRHLAEIESPDLTAAVARHRTANARQEAAMMSLQRAESLLAMQGISRATVEMRRAESEAASAEALAARQDLERLGIDATSLAGAPPSAVLPIAAPLPGTVLNRSVSPGLLVEKDAPLFEIADLATVWAVVDVYEKDIGLIQDQGAAEVRTDAYPGRSFEGRIALIEPALDEASRSTHARIVLDNGPGDLRPGMFVTATLPLRGSPGAEAAAVPAEALQIIGGMPVVFVEIETGRFELRPVETGPELHGQVEIRSGLREGEQVVVRGAFVLKSELLKRTIEGEGD